MDFTHQSYIFDAGQYDSIMDPVINFNETQEYPKQYIITESPVSDGPKWISINNADLKKFNADNGKRLYSENIIDYSSPGKPSPNSLNVSKNRTSFDITKRRQKRERFENSNGINLMSNQLFQWVLFILFAVIVVNVLQLLQSYTNSIVLKSLIKNQQNANNRPFSRFNPPVNVEE